MSVEVEELPDPLADRPEAGGMQWWAVVGIILLACGAAFIVIDSLKSETYFYTVDQALAQGPKLPGQHVRIKGTVEPGTIVGKQGELGRKFRITQKGKALAVTYDKALPDTFEENREVVVKGTVDDDMVLRADEVLVKCPSRYEGNPPTAMPNKNPRASL